jgi:hypothetical protein
MSPLSNDDKYVSSIRKWRHADPWKKRNTLAKQYRRRTASVEFFQLNRLDERDDLVVQEKINFAEPFRRRVQALYGDELRNIWHATERRYPDLLPLLGPELRDDEQADPAKMARRMVKLCSAVLVRQQERQAAATPRASPDDPGVKVPPNGRPDGTREAGRIWLQGQKYKLAEGSRQLLSYLLENPGKHSEDVAKQCGYQPESMQRRLTGLRKALEKALHGAPLQLKISTENGRILWNWLHAAEAAG